MRLGAAVALAAGLAGAPIGGNAQSPDRRAPLEAGISFTAPDGAPLARITPGQPFRVELSLTSITGSLPRALRPMAWIRPVALSDLPCTETAAAYRATGRGSAGTVDLNGLVFGILTQDEALTILDPERSVGTANLVSAQRFDEAPAAMIADEVAGRFILSLPQSGRVVAVAPMGPVQDLAMGLAQPDALAPHPFGGVWVLEKGSGDVLIVGDKGVTARLPLNARAIAVAGNRLAVLALDQVALLDPQGTALIRQAGQAAAVAASASDQGAALLWLTGDRLRIAWADAPDAPLEIPLHRRHDRLAVSPDGRFAFAFGGGAEVSVVDLSLSRVVQVVGHASPVAEVAFLSGAAFLRTGDGAMAGIMDLRMIKPGAQPVVGQFALGATSAPDPGAALLAPMQPEDQMLVVNAPGFTGFVLDTSHGTSGKPPMEAIPLRGGIPHIVRALDRGLRRSMAQASGTERFTTAARLPMAAEYEIVVSAGIGEASFCAPVPVDAPPPAPAALPGTALAERTAAGWQLLLRDGAGKPFAGHSGRLTVTSLIGNWRGRMDFQTNAEGRTAAYALPPPPLAILIESDGPGFAPLVME